MKYDRWLVYKTVNCLWNLGEHISEGRGEYICEINKECKKKLKSAAVITALCFKVTLVQVTKHYNTCGNTFWGSGLEYDCLHVCHNPVCVYKNNCSCNQYSAGQGGAKRRLQLWRKNGASIYCPSPYAGQQCFKQGVTRAYGVQKYTVGLGAAEQLCSWHTTRWHSWLGCYWWYPIKMYFSLLPFWGEKFSLFN